MENHPKSSVIAPGRRAHPVTIWIAVLLSAFFLVPELWLSPAISGLRGKFEDDHWVVWLLHLLLALVIFCVAYIGVRLSGLRLLEVVDGHWQFQRPVEYYLKAAAILLALLLAVDVSLTLAGDFSHSQRERPETVLEFLLAIFAAGTAGFTEEVVFRGFLLREFVRILNSRTFATCLQAIVFACAHGWDQTVIGWLDKFLSGLLFAWSVERTKSLIPAILVHSGLNLLATLLIGMSR